MITLFLFLFWGITFGCQQGFYSSGNDCLQWDSSCRECTEAGSWTSWEDFMFLNLTSGLCELWEIGDYFDISVQRCNTWEHTCSGYWYKICFFYYLIQVKQYTTLYYQGIIYHFYFNLLVSFFVLNGVYDISFVIFIFWRND